MSNPQGPEECHDKTVDTLVDVPEEQCDLNPQKTCRLITKLVPSLRPKQECTTVPKEVCVLKFTQPELRAKPLRTEWCLDEAGAASEPQAEYGAEPQAEYGAEPQAEYGTSARRGRVITSSSNRNSINNRVNNNNNRGNNNRPKSNGNRIVGSGSSSQLIINSNRLTASGNGGTRGGNGNRKPKNNRGSGNNRSNNNRVSSSRLVNNNNNRGSPPRIVANGNRIVGIGSQVVNSGDNARPLPVSNTINLSNSINSNNRASNTVNLSNSINNNNNRASNSINLPIGSAPFTRPAQASWKYPWQKTKNLEELLFF